MDKPIIECPDCGEEVYEDMLRRHYMKDHDYEIADLARSAGISYLEVYALVLG